jgi:cell division protein FtsI/penicillin-binding protein 2
MLMARWLYLFGILFAVLAAAIVWTVAGSSAVNKGEANADAAGLYEELYNAGLLREANGELRLPDRDASLLAAQAALRQQPLDPPSSLAAALTARLYSTTSRAGLAVIEAVGLYNRTRWIAAVRDQRSWSPNDVGVILPGDRPSAWIAVDRYGRRVDSPPLSLPELYGFVNGKMPAPGMGDWLVVAGGQPLRLVSRMPAAGMYKHDLAIQVVGHLDVQASRLPAAYRLLPRCRMLPCSLATAEATVIELPAGKWEGEQIELAVTPVPARNLAISGLALCPRRDPSSLPQWCGQNVRYYATAEHHPVVTTPRVISTADGVVIWRDGRPTAAAWELGMIPLLGVDSRHGWSLARLLAPSDGREGPRDVRLTINSRVQRAAKEALYDMVQSRFEGRADDAVFAPERIAVLIITDPTTGGILAATQWPAAPAGWSSYDHASTLSGEQLEGSPMAPLGWIRHRDLVPGSTFKLVVDLAVTEAASTRPELARAISGCAAAADGSLPCLGIGLHQTSYRGIDNFHQENLGKDLMEPRRASSCVADVKPSPIVDMAYAIQTSSNIWHAYVAFILEREAALAYERLAGQRPNRAPPGARPQASWRDLPDLQDSRIVAWATRLGMFNNWWSLVEDDLPPWMRPSDAGWRMDKVQAIRSRLADLMDPATKEFRDTGAVSAVTQASIGTLNVTPLHMAGVAGAILSGSIRPAHLILALDDQVVTPRQGTPLGVDRTQVQVGMKQAAESGTSKGAFSGDAWLKDDPVGAAWLRDTARCKMFAKTGTAVLPKRLPCPDPDDKNSRRCKPGLVLAGRPEANTGWLVGYSQMLPAARAGGESLPPMAYSCAITLIHGRLNGQPTDTGGSTCAYAVADLYRKLSRTGESRTTTAAVAGVDG